MRWENILQEQPTKNYMESYEIFFELLAYTPWRCYSSEQFPNIEWMIEEFIGGQATMPGLVSESLRAFQPMQVLYGKGGPYNMRGALYMNGAFFDLQTHTSQRNILLFVDEEVATVFNYPEQGWINTAEFFMKRDGEEHGEDATPSQ